MFVGGRWRLLRCIILVTFLAICIFIVYLPRFTTAPTNQDPFRENATEDEILITNSVVTEVVGWEFNVTRDVTQYINTTHDTTVINGKEICEGSRVYTVIIVTSAPSNFVIRSVIRETWASYNISSVKVGFLLGLPGNASVQSAIEEESAEFKDIIQDHFHDSYNNLTLKSVVLLKWFLRHCSQTVYLMKADDDTYVNIPTLSKRLMLLPRHSVLMGVLICRARPISHASSKWYSPKYLYSDQYYPDYLSGTGYVMTRDVASKLYTAALRTPIFYLEDIYITGICAKKAGIRPKLFSGFSYLHSDVSKCNPDFITNHRITLDEFRTLWAMRDNCTATKPTKPPKRKKSIRNACH